MAVGIASSNTCSELLGAGFGFASVTAFGRDTLSAFQLKARITARQLARAMALAIFITIHHTGSALTDARVLRTRHTFLIQALVANEEVTLLAAQESARAVIGTLLIAGLNTGTVGELTNGLLSWRTDLHRAHAVLQNITLLAAVDRASPPAGALAVTSFETCTGTESARSDGAWLTQIGNAVAAVLVIIPCFTLTQNTGSIAGTFTVTSLSAVGGVRTAITMRFRHTHRCWGRRHRWSGSRRRRALFWSWRGRQGRSWRQSGRGCWGRVLGFCNSNASATGESIARFAVHSHTGAITSAIRITSHAAFAMGHGTVGDGVRGANHGDAAEIFKFISRIAALNNAGRKWIFFRGPATQTST